MKRRNQKLRFQTPNVIQLNELGESSLLKGVQLAKVGEYSHAAYGDFKITRSMLSEMIGNFDSQVYGQAIFADIEHDPAKGAAARIESVYMEGEWLLADMSLTPYGRREIEDKSYIYLSIDYSEAYVDNANKELGAVLFGAGFTTRPFIKGQMGITLAEPTGKNTMSRMEKLLAELARLKAGKKLSSSIAAKFKKELSECSDDDAEEVALQKYIDIAGVSVEAAEDASDNDQPEGTVVSIPATPQLSEDAIDKLVTRKLAEKEAEAARLAEAGKATLKAKKKLFTDKVNATKLSDDKKAALNEKSQHVTAGMPDDSIIQLAEDFIQAEDAVAVARQLGSMGYNVGGSPRIVVGDDQDQRKLQDTIIEQLRLTNGFANNQLVLTAQDKDLDAFTQKILAAFDANPDNAWKLRQEHKVLSGNGEMGLDNPWFPVGYQRTVIRELFHDFKIMELVQTLVDITESQVVNIPYEEIDHTQFAGDGIVFEGQGIDFANAGFTTTQAYVLAMKIAMKVSAEVIHFTRSSGVNWEAWSENISALLRIMRVRITRRLANEIQRASDTFEALNVVNESVGAQLGGTSSVFKTAMFPIVRPHQQRNMQGDPIGLPENPIVLVVGGVTIEAWDMTGKQAAGTYYHLKNLNLGYIQFVNEVGVPQTPASAAATISYSYATNIIKFDLNYNAATTDYEKHISGLLKLVGDRDSMMSTERYVETEYLMLTKSLKNEISKASDFIKDQSRRGTGADSEGYVDRIKSIPTFSSNAPNLDFGSERIHMGVRNTTTYKIVKTFGIGESFQAVDSTGKPTDQKMAFGTEYNAIKTPEPVRNRSTGIIVYNSTTR